MEQPLSQQTVAKLVLLGECHKYQGFAPRLPCRPSERSEIFSRPRPAAAAGGTRPYSKSCAMFHCRICLLHTHTAALGAARHRAYPRRSSWVVAVTAPLVISTLMQAKWAAARARWCCATSRASSSTTRCGGIERSARSLGCTARCTWLTPAPRHVIG
eukprot:355471-Chlamydomonas_euryale.AAC.4